jgi:arginine N-succinyltransferase
MSAGDYLIRPVRESDLPAFRELRVLAGPGFTSLQASDEALEERLAKSAATFAAQIDEPGADQRYLLVLEHRPTGTLAGVAGVKACVGEQPPFYNFRVLRIAQASAAAQRRFDMEVLILVNEFTGCTEVGSLFVKAEHRVGGIGRMLAQSRYMLMAAAPQRFSPSVVSELRGVVDADGKSPFWEHLGRHFFKMTFPEADTMSATTDNQFILDLMPKYPIYADLLPDEARDVIGKCHPAGEGALKLLQWEGFRYEHVVDIFDGGPLVTAPRDTIRTFRESRRMPLMRGAGGDVPALLARPAIGEFRCVAATIALKDGAAVADSDTLAALGLEDGETALIWCNDAH